MDDPKTPSAKQRPTLDATSFLDLIRPVPAASGSPQGFQPNATPAEARAAEATRVAREMTDAATSARHATSARLRLARQERDGDDATDKPA